MARPAEPGLLGRIVRAATLTFIRSGYRGCRIERVAERAEVSVGTIYRYVAGKEALFELVVREAFGQLAEDEVAVPFQGSGDLDFVDELWRRLLDTHPGARLRAAAEAAAPADVGAELESIIREIYRWELRYWKAIRLIERCARDWPELDLIYYRQFRRELLSVASRYLARRAAAGHLAAVPDPDIAARVLGEAIAFFALHRHTAPDSEGMDDAVIEDTLVLLLTSGLLPRDAARMANGVGRASRAGGDA